MIMFNLIFGLAMFVAIRTLLADLGYLSMIKHAAAVATIPSIYETLEKNTHFQKCCDRATRDFALHLKVWLPLSAIAAMTMGIVWYEGYINNWIISEGAAIWSAIAMTSVYARPWTHPIDLDWLVRWSFGMKAVLISTQYQNVLDLLEEANEIPDDELTTEDMIKIGLLLQQKKQLENIIGTLPEPPSPDDSAQ